MAHAKYILRTKDGHYELAADGGILYDSTRNYRSDGQGWKIIGIATRHNSYKIISLHDAANGVPIGQGWVHDSDHGTHRMWCMLKCNRAVSVELAA